MSYDYYYDYYKEYKRMQKPKRGFWWFLYRVFVWIGIIFCVLALVTAVQGRKNPDEGMTVLGKQLRLILSDSMAECAETDVSEYEIKSLPVNTVVAIELVPKDEEQAKRWYEELKVGDVLTFRYVYVTQETLTHRITKLTPKGEGYVIELQGDNKASDSETLTQTIDTTDEDSFNYIIGKVVWQNDTLGWIMATVRTPIGIICFIILPSLLLFSLEVYMLAKRNFERKMRRARATRRRRTPSNTRNDYYGYHKR